MNAGFSDQNGSERENSSWPIRLLLRTGLVATAAQAERILLAVVAVIFIVTAWTFMHEKPVPPDPSGEKSPIEERMGTL